MRDDHIGVLLKSTMIDKNNPFPYYSRFFKTMDDVFDSIVIWPKVGTWTANSMCANPQNPSVSSYLDESISPLPISVSESSHLLVNPISATDVEVNEVTPISSLSNNIFVGDLVFLFHDDLDLVFLFHDE